MINSGTKAILFSRSKLTQWISGWPQSNHSEKKTNLTDARQKASNISQLSRGTYKSGNPWYSADSRYCGPLDEHEPIVSEKELRKVREFHSSNNKQRYFTWKV